jgi:hypothetical protein
MISCEQVLAMPRRQALCGVPAYLSSSGPQD